MHFAYAFHATDEQTDNQKDSATACTLCGVGLTMNRSGVLSMTRTSQVTVVIKYPVNTVSDWQAAACVQKCIIDLLLHLLTENGAPVRGFTIHLALTQHKIAHSTRTHLHTDCDQYWTHPHKHNSTNNCDIHTYQFTARFILYWPMEMLPLSCSSLSFGSTCYQLLRGY